VCQSALLSLPDRRAPYQSHKLLDIRSIVDLDTAIITQCLVIFPHYLQEKSVMVFKMGHDRFCFENYHYSMFSNFSPLPSGKVCDGI